MSTLKLSLAEFITLVPQLQNQVADQVQQALTPISEDLVSDAKGRIGFYQPGWDPLADATKKNRARLGFPPDAPLSRRGVLRESYGAMVSENRITIGSTDPVAEEQEIGTATIPPRPVVLPTVMDHLKTIGERLGQVVVDALSDRTRIDQ